jgi:hypothetical protein
MTIPAAKKWFLVVMVIAEIINHRLFINKSPPGFQRYFAARAAKPPPALTARGPFEPP